MPHPLQIDLINYQQKLEHAQRSFQISGLYTIASPESQIYRRERGFGQSYKVGKSWDICKRMNEYLLAYPFVNPGMQIHLLLLMPHAITKEEKSNVDRAEQFVLKLLKDQYPNNRFWPGIKERFRLFQKRSEWIQCPLEKIELAFREATKQNFGPMLIVRNSRHVDVPKLWTEFKAKVQSDRKEKRDREVAAQEKDADFQRAKKAKKDLCESIYRSQVFKPRAR